MNNWIFEWDQGLTELEMLEVTPEGDYNQIVRIPRSAYNAILKYGLVELGKRNDPV